MIKIFSLENLFSDSTHKSTVFEPAQIEAVEAAVYTKIVRGKERLSFGITARPTPI